MCSIAEKIQEISDDLTSIAINLDEYKGENGARKLYDDLMYRARDLEGVFYSLTGKERMKWE